MGVSAAATGAQRSDLRPDGNSGRFLAIWRIRLEGIQFLCGKTCIASLVNLDGCPARVYIVMGDPETRTLMIEDSGVGMTKSELMDSLGTIARSGTAKFAAAVAESKGDANLIGKFGVGFYSSFLVADKVTVATKSADDDTQWVWESEVGSTKFSVRPDTEGEPLGRGTRITLHLKEDCEEMAKEATLSQLLKTYSEFISFPIKLWKTDQVSQEVVDEEKTREAQEKADKEAEEKGEEKKQIDPIMKTTFEDVKKFMVQNDNKPLWVRSPKDVTDEEYNEFFKTTFKEFMPPLAKNHFNVEGTIEFSGILFVPGMAPFEQVRPSNIGAVPPGPNNTEWPQSQSLSARKVHKYP
eukprot:scaffold48326_cov28-Prasinocladus_malaysianus.AAC.1